LQCKNDYIRAFKTNIIAGLGYFWLACPFYWQEALGLTVFIAGMQGQLSARLILPVTKDCRLTICLKWLGGNDLNKCILGRPIELSTIGQL
jgi:hypothetical protein